MFVAGGYDGVSQLDNVERYDSVSQSWEHVPPLPTARPDCSAAAFGGMLYVVGGYGQHGDQPRLRLVERYDGVGWNVGPPMISPRSYFASAVWKGW